MCVSSKSFFVGTDRSWLVGVYVGQPIAAGEGVLVSCVRRWLSMALISGE